MKPEFETPAPVSRLLRPSVTEPDTAAGTDLAPAASGVDAELDRRAIVEEIDAPARRLAPSRGFGHNGRATNRAVVPQQDDPTRGMPSAAEFRSRLDWFIGVSDAGPQDPGALTYEPYFGLREKPFSLASDPRFFCRHSSHGPAFDALAGGIRRREGILVLTGEVGTGKTTLCRAVLQSLDQKTFAAYVPDPFLSREDLLKTLLVDFGVVSVDEIRSGRLRGATRTDLSYPLYDFLTSLQPLKAFAVVMIDEAQNLTTDLLEEIRILSDLDHGHKLLEVLLVGQPELRSRLAAHEMRQLSQRISIRCELSPLVPEDVKPYVSRRLLIAGNDGRVQFTDAAIDIAFSVSRGIPRVINLLCDRALLRAARSQTMTVDAEHVVWAVDDLKLPAAQESPVPIENPLDVFQSESSRPESLSRPIPSESGLDAGPVPSAGAFLTEPLTSRSGVAKPRFDGQFAAPRARRGRLLMLVCGCLALTAGFVGYRHATAPVPQRPTDVLAQPAVTERPAQPPPGNPADEANTKAPRTSAREISPAHEDESAAVPAVLNRQSMTGFALRMATFQSPTRAAQALQEFRDAGYRAYSLEVQLRDGTSALAVFLGPYTELASAEQDLERARQMRGYGSGLVVQLGSAPVTPHTQP